MMLGTAGVVKLWPAGKQLVIGEGLETMLAAATRLPYRDRAVAARLGRALQRRAKQFPIIDGVERLILLADNDRQQGGRIAAEACKQRWLEAGRRVALLMPDRPETHFNDIVLANLERAQLMGLPQKNSNRMRPAGRRRRRRHAAGNRHRPRT